MVRFAFVLAVLSVVVAVFGSGAEAALTYRYRPLGGELKFVRQPDKFDDYDTSGGVGNIPENLLDLSAQEQLLMLDQHHPFLQQLQQQHLHQQQQQQQQQANLQQQQRSSPFESFIRRWASIGNGYGRKITRAASF